LTVTNRLFSLIAGVFYVVFGVLGFIPALLVEPWSSTVWRNTGIGPDTKLLLRCLPVTPASNVLHLLIGLAGVVAAVRFEWSLKYARGLAILMTLLAINGLLPLGLNTYWGFLPLSGGVLAFHLMTAPMAFYFGYVYLFDAETSRIPGIA
jgi:hypothetical protein